MNYIDTNVFIHAISGADLKKTASCQGLFRRLERSEEGTTSEATIAEVVWVLSNRRIYSFGRSTIVERLIPLLRVRGLHLANRETIISALEIYASTRLDFVDALATAYVVNENLDAVVSFDKDFDKIGVPRVEP